MFTVLFDMVIKKDDNEPKRIVLCISSLGGMVALSPNLYWMIQNTAKRSTNPTNNPTILLEFHGYCVPPHCRANNRQQTAPKMSAIPRGSR